MYLITPTIILEANLTAATLLGIPRNELVKMLFTRFIIKEDQNIYYNHRKTLLETGEAQLFELQMLNRNGAALRAYLNTTLTYDIDNEPLFRIVVVNISKKTVEPDFKDGFDEK